MTDSQSDFDVSAVVSYWLVEAEEALRVADHLIEKSDYSYALFFGHHPDLKRTFRQKSTPDFTHREMARIKEVFQWLRSQLPSGEVSNVF
jgi:hypothetical protein